MARVIGSRRMVARMSAATPSYFGDPEMADDSGFVRQGQRILLSAAAEEPVWIDVHRRYGIVGPIAVISEHEIVREELDDRFAYRGTARFGPVDKNQLESSDNRSAVVRQETTLGHFGTPTAGTAPFKGCLLEPAAGGARPNPCRAPPGTRG
jgi:hypothetical protein